MLSSLSLSLPTAAFAQTPSGPPFDFLAKEIGYSPEELSAITDGNAVTKVLETPEQREIAISGVVHLHASTSFFLRMFRDIESFDTAALAAKKLSNPILSSDFTAMDIPDEDLAGLEDCEPGDCSMKLGRESLERIRAEVDWRAADAASQAESILQEQAFRSAQAYVAGGSEALGGYDDKDEPDSIGADFASLLANAPYVLDYRPELHRYLVEYPDAELPGATDFLYWAQYDYGKPVIRVNHVTIYPTEDGDNGSAIVTAKHLWYTHYFTTGLDLYVLVRDASSEGEAFYLVTLTRMRTDGVGSGFLGKVLKKKVVESVTKNVRLYLTSVKDAVERYYADARARR